MRCRSTPPTSCTGRMQVAWAELGVEPPAGPGARLPQRACRTAGGWARRRPPSSPASSPRRRLHDLSRGLAGDDVDLAFANSLASRLEGHPDNASASVHGGVDPVVDRTTAAGTTTVHLPVHPDVEPVVFAPDAQLSTAKARSVLPQQVAWRTPRPTRRARPCSSHALGAAPEHLLAATRDWLHQEARRSSYAGSMALVDAAARRGPRRRRLRRRAPRCSCSHVRDRVAEVRAHGGDGLAGADPRHPRARRACRGARPRLTGRCRTRAPPARMRHRARPSVLLWALRPQSMPGISRCLPRVALHDLGPLPAMRCGPDVGSQ